VFDPDGFAGVLQHEAARAVRVLGRSRLKTGLAESARPVDPSAIPAIVCLLISRSFDLAIYFRR
jgi:hypothetical protein